jgi:hypothetical protein
MQDFYIVQKTSKPLTSDQALKWYLTVEMLGPENVLSGDDETTSMMLAAKGEQFYYILPLTRHLSNSEAETIVNGYLRVSSHDFEIEASSVYDIDPDFGVEFEYDITIEDEAKNVLLSNVMRHNHNTWIQEKLNDGWRFGLDMNIVEKTHPAMRPWDDLPENYRRTHGITNKDLVEYFYKNYDDFT